jgi:acyl-CoA thioester hydrolase
MARLRFPTPLRWSDMDAYGHVNNVQFLRLLEDARVQAFHGHDSDDGGSMLGTGVLVSRHEIEYLAPLHYRPEPVGIDLWVTSISGASFEMGYEVLDDESTRDGAGRVVYARAESTMVVYDLKAQRPRRLEPSERARLEAWLDEPVQLRRRRVEQRRTGTGAPA